MNLIYGDGAKSDHILFKKKLPNWSNQRAIDPRLALMTSSFTLIPLDMFPSYYCKYYPRSPGLVLLCGGIWYCMGYISSKVDEVNHVHQPIVDGFTQHYNLCIYIYAYVCMYVCMYVYIYTYTMDRWEKISDIFHSGCVGPTPLKMISRPSGKGFRRTQRADAWCPARMPFPQRCPSHFGWSAMVDRIL